MKAIDPEQVIIDVLDQIIIIWETRKAGLWLIYVDHSGYVSSAIGEMFTRTMDNKLIIWEQNYNGGLDEHFTDGEFTAYDITEDEGLIDRLRVILEGWMNP